MAANQSDDDPDKLQVPLAAGKSPQAPGLCERRRHRRRGVDTTAVIRLISLAADVHGRILDISLGGCRIRTERRFPVGIFRRVEVEFRVDGMPFRLGGVTQAIHDPLNVGIRFLDLSDRKRAQLLQLIEEIGNATEHRDGLSS